jgi:hypothetical protein
LNQIELILGIVIDHNEQHQIIVMLKNCGVEMEKFKQLIEKNVILMKLIQIGVVKNVVLLVSCEIRRFMILL